MKPNCKRESEGEAAELFAEDGEMAGGSWYKRVSPWASEEQRENSPGRTSYQLHQNWGLTLHLHRRILRT